MLLSLRTLEKEVDKIKGAAKNILLFFVLAFIALPSFGQDDSTVTQVSDSPHQSIAFDVDSAVNSYIDVLSDEEQEKSDSYFEGGYWLILWGFLVDVVIAWIFLSLGLSRWMKNVCMKVKRVNLQNLIFVGLYMVFSFILAFPYSLYVNFIREHRYDLSNMSFGGWFGEELIDLAVNLVLVGILLVIIYWVIRKTREKWWIWASAVCSVFIFIVIFISPVFISPLFNEYSELPEGELKAEILSLARANGIPTDHVYQFDASKQSKRISANVSGIGKTIRISLNDNLLNRCSDAEIKAVMAHEMGHYVLNHIPIFVLVFTLLFLLGFGLSHLSFNYLNARFGKRWNISGISDIGGLPLLVVILSFYMVLATPITNNLTRSTETEADIFGLNAAREPDGFASVAMMTSEYRKVSPGHWEEIFFYDHPSPHSRVLMAMKWKAENLDR